MARYSGLTILLATPPLLWFAPLPCRASPGPAGSNAEFFDNPDPGSACSESDGTPDRRPRGEGESKLTAAGFFDDSDSGSAFA